MNPKTYSVDFILTITKETPSQIRRKEYNDFLLFEPYSITKFQTQSSCCSMTQGTEIGLECLPQTFVGNLSFLYHFNFLIQLSNHSSFSSFAQRTIVWKRNISKEIDTTAIFSYRDLTGVQFQIQIVTKKVLYFGYQFFQKILTFRNSNKIIRVANIISYFQFLFHKLIEFVHINIGKKLRGQIADRKSFSSKKIRGLTSKAFYYFFHKPQGISVFYFSPQKLNQNGVVNAIKKLSHVALKRVCRLTVVSRYFSKHFIQHLNPFVSSFSNTTRERMGYKGRLKNWVENFKNCMVQHTVSDRGFVYMSKFRIVNIKTTICSVFILFTY